MVTALSRLRDRRGTVSVPLFLSLAVMCTAGFGIWGVLRTWRFHVETQLRLDRCTAKTAIQLRDTLTTVSKANREIQALRIAILGARGAPAAIPPLEAALFLEVARQEFARKRWDAHRIAWITRTYCRHWKDQPRPLPSLDWVRAAPDHLGPRPLRWVGVMPRTFRVQIGHAPRAAAARIAARGEMDESTEWMAEWAAPSAL
ncbi:MAG: hypothetical protein NDJ90_12075 [Oligoflexia bacterium]|nr:hypothetical protein [Oligoflexia bacterium]